VKASKDRCSTCEFCLNSIRRHFCWLRKYYRDITHPRLVMYVILQDVNVKCISFSRMLLLEFIISV